MFTKILNWGLIILAFLIPLFFLPLTTEFYEFNKNVLLIGMAGLLFVGWGLKMLSEKKVAFKSTPFDLPVLGLAAAFTLSTLLVSVNKWEALWLPGGTGTILALTALYFILTNNLEKEFLGRAINAFFLSAAVLALVAVYQFIGVGQVLVPANAGLEWLRVKTFTPAGGPLVLAVFLGVILILTLGRIYAGWKNQKSLFDGGSVGLLVILVIVASGLGLTLYQLLTTAKPILLPLTAGWFVALEAFKRFPLLGVGPENFLVAFTQGKPISLNLGELWAVQFGVSANYYLQVLTTVGILGLGALLILLWRVIKKGLGEKGADSRELVLCLLAVFLILALLPANLLLLVTFYLLLGLLGTTLTTSEIKKESNWLPTVLFLVIILAVGASFYGMGRVFAAEVYFRQSLEAAAKNLGTDTYNLQVKTIQTNPYNDLYHIAYSQTNLALANSLATKKDLTDQDRQNVSQLIQQSIREAKAAAALDPGKAQDWENLAAIYRQLINVAQGSDQWTIAAYNQAISLDPANPLLRLNLGGVYYSLKNYDEAIRQFGIAINLKPDFANGHYNLAAALGEKGLVAEAITEMEQTQALVEPGSNDFKKVAQELEALRAKLPKQEPQTGPAGTPETLTPPASPIPEITPPLTLPKDVQPEISTSSGR